MKAISRTRYVVLLVGMLATSVFAAQTSNSVTNKNRTQSVKTLKADLNKQANNCRLVKKCHRNKGGKSVCKKQKLCKRS